MSPNKKTTTRARGGKRKDRSNTVEMKTAISLVKSGKSIREAAKLTNIPYATVRRYYIKSNESYLKRKSPISNPSPVKAISAPIRSILKKTFRPEQPKPIEPESWQPKPTNSNDKIFTVEQELELCRRFNNKSNYECRKLAYQIAYEWKVKVPDNWLEEEAAAPDWMGRFRKRNLILMKKRAIEAMRERAEAMTERAEEVMRISAREQDNVCTPRPNINLLDANHLLNRSSTVRSLPSTSTAPERDEKPSFQIKAEEYERTRALPQSWDKNVTNIFHQTDNFSEKAVIAITPYNRDEEVVEEILNDECQIFDNSINCPSNNSNITNNTNNNITTNNDNDNDSDSEHTHVTCRSVKVRKICAEESFLLSLLPALKKIPERNSNKVKIEILQVIEKNCQKQ